ncbi:hypothetical protein [Mycobacterium sp. 236(2023)]|nr:hypothetical protein [Mycobacterium sp. 236(2023)]MDG4668147.1 hypothetical protein [Mycobacterium sp. 236(2023)]
MLHTLGLAFTGALIQTATGAMPYDVAAQRLHDAVSLLLGNEPGHH